MQTDFASIFDSKMAENNIFKKVTELFSKFGLSQYESYIYIFLAKNGRKTASQIYKTLRIPKTETYRILGKLQGRGLVSSSDSKKARYFFQNIKKDCVKMILEKDRRNLCFAIKDDDEIVFFMKNENSKEKIAIWSDSTPIVTPLDLLFNIVWHNYKSTKEAGKYTTLEKTQQEYKFKIKELEQENLALTTLNRLLSNNKD